MNGAVQISGRSVIRTRVPIATAMTVAIALAVVAIAPARAEYPEHAIRIVVPYPPGGTTDLLARAIAPRLSERLRQSVVVENRAGAGGAIGAQAVAKSAADGYTLVFGTVATHGILPVLQKPAPYDAQKDFAPITLVANTPNVLVANPAQSVLSVAELLAQARAKPGTITFGSTSQGGSPHMSVELLKSMTQIDIVHVPYKGAAPMLTDLIGGQIQLGIDNLPSSMNHIRSGKIRALAVTTSKRWAGAAQIPTLAESGVPGYEAGAWFGLLAPGATPKSIVELLHSHVTAIIQLPEVEKYFLDQGAEPVGNTPDEFGQLIAREIRKWTRVIATTGVKLQ